MVTIESKFRANLILSLLWLALHCPSAIYAGSWQDFLSPELKAVEKELQAAKTRRANLGQPSIGQTVDEVGIQHLKLAEAPPESPWVQLDLGAVHPIGTVALIPAMLGFEQPQRASYAFPKRFRIDVSNDRQFRNFTRIFEQSDDDYVEVGFMPAVFHCPQVNARYVRLTVTKMPEVEGMVTFALSEFMVLDGNKNIAIGASVTMTNLLYLPPRWHPANLTDGRTSMGPPIQREVPEFDGLFCEAGHPSGERWMSVDLGKEYDIEEIRVHPVHARQGTDFPGFGFPSNFHVEVADESTFADSRVVFDTGPLGMSNPGNNPVYFTNLRRSARYVRFVCDKVTASSDGKFGLSELQVYSNDTNVAFHKPTTVSWSHEDRPTELLTDGFTSYGLLLELPDWLNGWNERRQLELTIQRFERKKGSLIANIERKLTYLYISGFVVLATSLFGLVVMGHRKRRREQKLFQTRLAQDLHDEIGSNLAGIARLSEVAAEDLHGGNSEDWNEVNRIACETTDALRLTLWLAGARQEAGVDLIPSLKKLVLRVLPGIRIEFDHWDESLPDRFGTESRRHVLLFFKEAIANVARHSRATQVNLSTIITPKQLTLQIKDNGVGFDVSRASSGTGLASMRRRAHDLGAELQFESATGQGTRLILRIPV